MELIQRLFNLAQADIKLSLPAFNDQSCVSPRIVEPAVFASISVDLIQEFAFKFFSETALVIEVS